MSAYTSLRTLYQQIRPLTQARTILGWDTRAMMPPGAGDERAGMMRGLDQAVSRLLRDVPVQKLLEEASHEELNVWDTENLHLMGREYIRHRAINEELAMELNQVARAGRMMWARAKADNNWNAMMPVFSDVIKAERKKIKILSETFNVAPYEVCLFDYVRGYKAKEVNDIMATLVRRLSSLVRTRRVPDPIEFPKISRVKQLKICRELMGELGFDSNHGRIDISAKAYHTSTDQDSRIGLKVVRNNVCLTMSSAVHEMGHALHKLHRPKAYHGQPVGSPGDFAMREAMAFIWQVHACRTPEFLGHASSVIRDIAHVDIPMEMMNDFYRSATRSPIRASADPVAYMMHIAVRTKIEQELLVEERDVETVPQRWAELYDEYLGVDVQDYASGCMQDIHWYKGAFGYFPAYALGHLNAAALMRHAESDLPDFRLNLSAGNGSQLVDWLERHVYKFANLYSGRTLTDDIMGAPVMVDDFIDRLLG